MYLLCMKQIQTKTIKEWEWLVIDSRAVTLTSIRHSCYATDSCWAAQTPYRACTALRWQLSRARPCPQPACSFVAQQAAANVDSRACTQQSNRLQSIRRYQGHAYVAKCAAIGRGELPAALRQSRLHTISAGDNRALIVWDNKSHRECAKAIGWAPLTYAQQSDIWQLVTFLPQMLKGFVSVECVVRIQASAPPALGSSLRASSACPSSRLHGLLVPWVLLAVLSTLSVAEALAISQSPGARWEICLK